MTYKQQIISGVNLARSQAKSGELIVTFLLEKKQNNSYSGGKNTPTYATSVNVECVHDKFEYDEIDKLQLKTSDVKVVAFIDSDLPDVGDKMTLNGLIYQVIKSTPTYAGDVVVISIVYLRI